MEYKEYLCGHGINCKILESCHFIQPMFSHDPCPK